MVNRERSATICKLITNLAVKKMIPFLTEKFAQVIFMIYREFF